MMIGEVLPILFVGLGGAGGKVVGRIARKLRGDGTQTGKWDYRDKFSRSVRFAVIDTDSSATKTLREGRDGYGPVDETFLVSDFDKQQYAAMSRGDARSLPDPYFTQWVYDEYKFRGGDTAGAGQIRIESRLGLYHALQTTDLHNRFLRLLNDLRDQLNTAAAEKAAVQVHVAFSVMGGTGSGTFLPFAYFLKNLASGIAPIRIFGYAIQPHVYQEVTGANFDDVCANAYASLKELDFLNQIELDKKGRTFEFHYDVPQRVRDAAKVKDRPYELTYLIDVPAAFSTPSIIDAVSDSIFMQIYSPLGEKQFSDVDNYVKQSRQLYPEDLAQETGKGFTTHYGSIGMCVLHVPDDDILRYCAIRFASDAVNRYLLMRDAEMVPKDLRDDFNRFQVPQEKLRGLSEYDLQRELDRVFARKVEYLAEKLHEQSFWSRIGTVAGGIQERFVKSFNDLVEKTIGRATASLPQLGAEMITEPTWLATAHVQRLRQDVQSARESLEAEFEALRRTVAFDWWPEFLRNAGPASAPSLTAYEQRYSLLVLRGICPTILKPGDALLSQEGVDRAVSEEAAASNAWSDRAFDDLAKKLGAKCDDLRETAGRSFWEKTFSKDKLATEFEDSRRAIAKTYNDQVAGIRKALEDGIRGRLLKALYAAADEVLKKFRGIDLKGVAAAEDLERRAESYRQSGVLREKLPDGSMIEHFSEANQYAIDEEIFLGPTGSRAWDWFYEDQIRPLLEGPEQMNAVQAALTETLKPKVDSGGRIVPRSGDQMVSDIVVKIREKAEAVLEPRIKGPEGKAGLMLDEGIALEAIYMKVLDSPSRSGGILHALREYREGDRPIDGLRLWQHPNHGIYVKTYAEQKVARAARHKASVLCDMDRGVIEKLKFADQTLVGAHDHYRGDSPFAQALRNGSGVPQDNFLKAWYDAKRVFFYHYIVGVPLYAFPRVLGQLQVTYRAFQAKPNKAWYLHCDKNFEVVQDLDPADLKEHIMLRLPLLFAHELLKLDRETGVVKAKNLKDDFVLLAGTLEDAAEELISMKRHGSERYEELFAPDIKLIALCLERDKLDSDARTALETLEVSLKKLVAGMEDDEDVDEPVKLAHKKLLTMTRKLLALRGKAKKDA